nr:MAG TPA: hypothetical protein [Caudoviricetes sp.]
MRDVSTEYKFTSLQKYREKKYSGCKRNLMELS